MVKFEATKTEQNTIRLIANRAEQLGLNVKNDRLTSLMDLEATHCNGTPLDFDKFLAFDDFNFAHDFFGIKDCINRRTGELKNCFVPRCSKRAILKIKQKINTSGEPIKYGETLIIDTEKLIGFSTKSLYVRKGIKNNTLFLSQRNNGANGKGDICKIYENNEIEVNFKMFERLLEYGKKANAIIK